MTTTDDDASRLVNFPRRRVLKGWHPTLYEARAGPRGKGQASLFGLALATNSYGGLQHRLATTRVWTILPPPPA
jgi:hypothetical protein